MSVLKPYIDKGTLVVKSGQTDFKTVAILRWDPATAQQRMEDLLTTTYSGGSQGARACCRRTTACPSASCPR